MTPDNPSPQEAVSRALAERIEKVRAVTAEMRRMMPCSCGDWADQIDAALLPKPLDPAVEACREIADSNGYSWEDEPHLQKCMFATYHAGAAHADTPLVEALEKIGGKHGRYVHCASDAEEIALAALSAHTESAGR